MRTLMATAAVFAGLAAIASGAFAQDYEQTEVSNQLLGIPTGATQLTVSDDSITEVDLPFEFPYYGGIAESVFVHDNGMMNIRPGGTPAGGSPWGNTAWPPASAGVTDGAVAPLWEDINPAAGGQIGHFTTGTAPNRKFVVYWNGVRHFYGGADQYTFQVHLHETTGRIVFAYGPDSGTWGPNLSYSTGLAAPGANDTRSVSPNTGANNSSHPGTDYQFDPTIRTYDGTVLIDEIISDDSGIGNSVESGVAPEGLRVELRSELGTAASATLDENGEFELRGVALDATLEGALHLVSSSAACRVSPSTTQAEGATYSFELVDGIPFDDDDELGTITVGSSNDSTGANREPIQIALAITRAREFLSDLTDDELPFLEVRYSGSDQARSRYQEARGEDEAFLRIGGAASGNPDAFDAWVCHRGWARHALKHLTGLESSTTTMDFDRQTDAGNALADALGVWVNVSLHGDSVLYDGVNGSVTEEFDLETPALTSPKGRDVGAWVASAIFDLMDADNEMHDVIDGTIGDAARRPIDVLDALSDPFATEDFLDEWDSRGHDSAGLVRNFVHHGLLQDDADEPNDSKEEATDAGTAGVRLDGRSLNRFNEDWYKVQVAETNTRFYVNVAYNRTAQDGVLLLELRTAEDRVLATGEYDGANGPMRAELPVFGPGELFIRLAHVDGAPIDDYTLQAFAQLTIGTSGAPEWTVRRPINQPIVVAGGIPPYELSVKPPATPPRGMLLDLAAGELRGSPLDVGTETFTIQVADSGSPKNTASSTQSFTVHPELSFTVPERIGVAQGKPTDINLGRTGGTNPITLSDEINELPDGLGLTEDFHIAGNATEGGGGSFAFTATDLAGSVASVDTTVVVCSPVLGKTTPLTIAANRGTAGLYFDALIGSLVNVSFKTARKNPKRALELTIIGPDGTAVEGGKVKIKPGLVVIKKLPIPMTGRYFVTLQSDDGGALSNLIAKQKTALPKNGAGLFENVQVDDRLYVEFGAMAGAKFTMKGKSKDGVQLQVQLLIKPDGGVIPINEIGFKETKKGFTLTALLDQTGTYGLYLIPKGGDFGDFSYKTKIKQPKKAVFALDD